ncbi:hypothetical protein PRIPAC_89887, partial [Pristionchus pacificus]|uniref:Uncharacterized protein n=1 Tax=Pristionchus pacificus TaxID=54126 RepID=A0A8R1V2A6_PRIPA
QTRQGEMLDILVVLVLGAVWALRWARKNGLFSPLLGSRLDGGCEQIDADLTDEGVPYPQRVPVSLGVLYTSPPAEGGQGKGLQQLAAFLLHCCRAGVRKVVVHGYSCSTCRSSSEKELARALEGVLAEYGQDRIRIESHAGVAAAAAQQQQHTREREEETDLSCTRVLILPARRSGRATMVEAAKELCRSPAPVTTAAVAGVLAGSMLDDLQAVVMVGSTPTLAAFPPWPLRIAELLPVAALPRAKADFVRAISAFGARDIRQGK